VEPEAAAKLLAYCGTYCGCCSRFYRHIAFRESANLLAEIVDSHSFQYWMPLEVKDFNYVEFRKGLGFFSREDTWFVCHEGCKGGGGDPPDCIRDCWKEHDADVCFECEEFPCDKVKGRTVMMERGKEYKRLGRYEWLKREDEKSRKVFESHTGKCYNVHVDS